MSCVGQPAQLTPTDGKSEMAFVPFVNCVEVVIRFTLAGIPIAIVIGGVNGGGVGPANQAALGTAIDTWRKTYLQPITNTELVATSVNVYDLTSASAPVTTTLATAPTAGATASDIPAQAAQVVSFRTTLRGRSYRGRNYVPGLTAPALQDTRTFTAATTASVLAAYAALPAAMATAGYGHVVLSRYSGNAPRSTGVSTLVNTYTAATRVDTQRRRLGPA